MAEGACPEEVWGVFCGHNDSIRLWQIPGVFHSASQTSTNLRFDSLLAESVRLDRSVFIS